MLRALILSVFIFVGSVGNAFSKPEDVDVYIMRGLFGFLFKAQGGVYRMAEELEEKGYNVHFECWQDTCRKKIIEQIKNNPKRKFVIIGHSMGGNGVTLIGRELAKYGIRIPYAAVIDAPVPVELETSFRIVDNFYQFNDWRNPVLVAKSKNTELHQFDYRRIYGHIEIADAPVVVNRIYKQISRVASR